MTKNLLQRAGLKLLSWLLQDTKSTRYHRVNKALYSRATTGRILTDFSHPQVEIGAHSYGVRQESFLPYHPDDRVILGKYCSVADGVRFVFGEHRMNAVST